MRQLGYALAAAVLASSPSSAGFQNGNDLYSSCENRVDQFCIGYVMAIADVLGADNPVNGYRACFRSGVTGRQIIDIVTKYLRQKPDERHYNAAGLVADALQSAFPCPLVR